MTRPPAWLAAVLLTALITAGWSLGQVAGSDPYATATSTDTLTHTSTDTDTTIRTVKRVTRGRVVTLPGGTEVLRVPTIIVRIKHHKVVVPAHLLPLTRRPGERPIARPAQPVTVTIYLTSPAPPAVTVTETSVTTTTEVIISTITLPLTTTGGDPEQEATP